MRRHRILLFDSGMGGLTVARAVRALMPHAALVYAADTAGFPYGAWPEARLVARIEAVIGALLETVHPDIVVIACNTASTLALDALRRRFSVPFVGTVPAIKTAAEQTRSGVIGVLATPGTARRDYTSALIHTYAYHCTVIVHGAARLADLAEAALQGEPPADEAVRREIAAVFKRRGGRRTDTVVLGCTHYPLILPALEAASPWPVCFIDPAPAIARRVAAVIGDGGQLADDTMAPEPVAPDTVVLTAPAPTRQALRAYAAFGFRKSIVLSLDAAPMPRLAGI